MSDSISILQKIWYAKSDENLRLHYSSSAYHHGCARAIFRFRRLQRNIPYHLRCRVGASGSKEVGKSRRYKSHCIKNRVICNIEKCIVQLFVIILLSYSDLRSTLKKSKIMNNSDTLTRHIRWCGRFDH